MGVNIAPKACKCGGGTKQGKQLNKMKGTQYEEAQTNYNNWTNGVQLNVLIKNFPDSTATKIQLGAMMRSKIPFEVVEQEIERHRDKGATPNPPPLSITRGC
jgi:hypothetical protein